MIGGGGEKKTLRMVAQYADESNIICAVEDIPRKLAALDAHCERLGRDRSEITVSYQTSVPASPRPVSRPRPSSTPRSRTSPSSLVGVRV
jgi:alkanesulfonate monooxygenase SsuD/methylene tetrahydromethanopterin reductase-like flavin-dependent oxidoreductase (luciferase family)